MQAWSHCISLILSECSIKTKIHDRRNKNVIKTLTCINSAPKSTKPWTGTGTFSCRGTISPKSKSMEQVFFSSQVGGTIKCAGGTASRMATAREVCSHRLNDFANLKFLLI